MRLLYRRRKFIALLLLILFVTQIVHVPIAYALTSGPTQPEVQAFQPAGTTDMVDLFTGDFSYNIPLFELPGPNGGYPFNLSYQAGVGMDTEASWVGLGWSLNPGAINRQMRGLPDEFKGDKIYTKMDVDPNVTVGLGAGVGLEAFGADKERGTMGLSISFNNFKGFGYSLDFSLGYGGAVSSGHQPAGRQIGIGISLDSNEGVSINPSLSMESKMGVIGVHSDYNSKAGLYSVGVSNTRDVTFNGGTKGRGTSISQVTTSASLSLVHPGYTPQVSMPMKNANISAKFKPGADWWGAFPNAYIKGFYNEQTLANRGKKIGTEAYGYLNYQHASGSKDVMDFNREKDGMVSNETPNLPIPSLTYDIYSATGQGIAAMYRPVRNDYGIIRDPASASESGGLAVGVDAAPAASKTGVNLGINHSKSTSGNWTDKNEELAAVAKFRDRVSDNLFEPWYFKVHGELAGEKASQLDSIGGTEPVRIHLDEDNTAGKFLVTATSDLDVGNTRSRIPDIGSRYRERKKRSQVIQPITKDQLMNGNLETVSCFKVKYIDNTGAEKVYDRSALPGHHTVAFTALTPEGLRYNYGIPAYNLKQEEVTYSARKRHEQDARVEVGNEKKETPDYKLNYTNKFLKKVEMPGYAHAYLLTSIVGPDYVDVTGNGVTEDDLGYWVKFTYKKTTTSTDPYKWRDPFSKAHYIEGWKTDPQDDKGSFVYGEKEMWYLVRAETKSHIATFTLEERADGKGVLYSQQDHDYTGKSVYKLKEINLFTRAAGMSYVLKKVKFQYDESLCRGVYNNNDPVSDTTGGKLTLKKVWFEYGNSTRGQLNPYEFTYHTSNPDYDLHAYDRWGNYKPYPATDSLYNTDFPYALQDSSQKEAINDYAASWSLTQIRLPSGGKIMVDYESDDYGYVQHLPAMQMMEIVNPYSSSGTVSDLEKYILNDDAKIRFRLEHKLPGDLSVPQQQAEVLKYLDRERKQVYFKVKINLRSDSENYFEYISCYADINFDAPMGLEKDADGNYAYGYFSLVREKANGKYFNPLSMRAWQHIRANQPELANTGKKFEPASSTSGKVSQIKSIGNIFVQIRQMFEGFYRYCEDKRWGREVVVGKSWVRLNSPDKVKYGGGLRVQQITMLDNWKDDKEGVYGQVYDYTMEEKGEIISSGVAAYEPFIGGEENPLRYAKKYTQSVPLHTDNNQFFEFPVNESYYPGPQVGYRKVTVTSLAAARLNNKRVKHADGVFPHGPDISYGTTGQTIHEFYTAKDFPVITDETPKGDKTFNMAVPIPFLGSISVSKLTSSQGYSIVTNDMHGKPYKVSNYRQNKQGRFEPQPISWVKYNYLADTTYYQGKKVSSLSAKFRENEDGTLSVASPSELNNNTVPKFTLGQENEFFLDMREFLDKTWEGGGSLDVDIIYVYIIFGLVPIPIPTTWPNVSKSENLLRTAVTNKVIFKSGILESMEAYDGGSRVKTQNIKWDKQTGQVVLSTVNNNFNAPVYSYTIPAYTQYQGMGAAYQNVGLTFSISSLQKDAYKDELYRFNTSVGTGSLHPGDEILLYPDATLKTPVAKVVYMGNFEEDDILYTDTPLSRSTYSCMIVRSGYRNQLGVAAGTISALSDPSEKGVPVTYKKSISTPK